MSVLPSGCKVDIKKCPCRLWMNCPTYTDRKRQLLRLQGKKYYHTEWYKDVFRVDAAMGDATNG